MRLPFRSLLVSFPFVVAFVVGACDSDVSADLSGILAGRSGASCTNTTPGAGGGAGGCDPGFLCFRTYCVQEGALRISLAFTADTDLDLHVFAPSGEEIWWKSREAARGKLDVDQCVKSCGAANHVENVFFTGETPGDYRFYVQNFEARSAADFTVEVAANGQTRTFSGSVPAKTKATSETFTFAYPPARLADAGTD